MSITPNIVTIRYTCMCGSVYHVYDKQQARLITEPNFCIECHQNPVKEIVLLPPDATEAVG